MWLSRPSHYAIRALAYLASQPPGKLSGTGDVAMQERIPEAFLGKVLQQLRRGRLVRSYRGTGGGYELAQAPDKITLMDVVQCIEGPNALQSCVLEDRECSPEKPCALHYLWLPAQQCVMEFFRTNTVESLARSRRAGEAFVPPGGGAPEPEVPDSSSTVNQQSGGQG